MTTPARQQYLDIKAHHQDALLAFQVGDFFEFFDEDARIAAQELQIVLTSRSYGPGEHVPLAGVPVHALDAYLARLVVRGYRVAVCEQVSPPGRGLVRREVTRILTPGTVVESAMLSPTRDNYLAAVAQQQRTGARGGSRIAVGLAYVDVSTGAFACTSWQPEQALDAISAELQRLAPAEVLIAASTHDGADLQQHQRELGSFAFSECPDVYFEVESARLRLCRHFGTPSLAAFGCDDAPLAIAAAGAILAYLERMNPSLLRLLTNLRTYSTSGFVEMDARTLRALELVEPAHTLTTSRGTTNAVAPATLLMTLDATRTPMGSRLLRRQLLEPLRQREILEERLDAVAELHARPAVRERVAALLDGLGDLERLTGRIVQGLAVPRELHALRSGLQRMPMLRKALRTGEAAALRRLGDALSPCDEACALIERALADPTESSGRMLRGGYSPELDALVASVRDSRQWIAALEPTERERTGIKSLKVGYNKVFGYYIEVSRPNISRVPEDYQRRQTLSTGERYVTAELKEHEALVLHAEEQISALERDLYSALLQNLAEHSQAMRQTSAALAQLDAWLALAEVALARGYVRPELSNGGELEIVGGRHPIVEATLDGSQFIANDTLLRAREDREDGEAGAPDTQVLLLTGPNMAGKSTYLRQVAAITLLAQIGSFVPATRARIGLVDRIFTRVGAEDDLARGLSTFMLEMVETAHILRHATAASLVILDEVGRGTSTTDGVAIARAVVEHLHDVIGARTLFATHYHELADLEASLARLKIYRMAVAERDGHAVFLHRVVPGASETSYGIQVAQMAGLPESVILRAIDLLGDADAHNEPDEPDAHLASPALAETRAPYGAQDDEAQAYHHEDNTVISLAHHRPQREAESQRAAEHEVALALASLNVAAITPIEALNLLFSLQQRALAALHADAGR